MNFLIFIIVCESVIYKFCDSRFGGRKAKKSKGATIYVRILGTSSDADEITRLEAEARAYIREQECRDRPDELRRPGHSKDGKHSNPQIVLGLLVSGDGCPLAFAVHEGSKYEGHTMLPVVKDFTARYGLDDFVVVADSGMMNEANVRDLEESGYKYIIGARIRNMSPEVTAWVLSGEKDQSVVRSLTLDAAANKRLLVGYSEQRARLDERNRDKGLKKLRAKFASGTITKSKITQRGYNKFLRVTGNESLAVSVGEDQVESDRRWDGLKGYISNAPLPESQIIEAYHGLYNVEQSFRIAKSKLEIRPIFHFNHKRIRAHISICFVALKVYRELDRLMKRNGMRISVDAALEIAKTIPTIRVKFDGGHITKTLFLTQRHKLIQPLFEDDFWGSQS